MQQTYKCNTFAFVLRVALILVFFTTIHPVSGSSLFSCKGFISDDQGEPLMQVMVRLQDTDRYSFSDSSGSFVIPDVPAGQYVLQLTLHGFETQTDTITIPCNDPLSYTLQEDVQWLHQVEVHEHGGTSKGAYESLNSTVVDKDDLEVFAGQSVAEAMSRISGVNAMTVGVGISKPMIRGMGQNRLVVMDNGVRHEGQQWGSDHGLEIAPASVEQVEVIRGAAGLLYGSDATAGVVRFMPAPIPVLNSVNGSVSQNFRTVNDQFGSRVTVHGNRKDVFAGISVSYQRYGDYRVPSDTFRYNDYRLRIYNERLKNTAGRDLGVSGRIGVRRKWGKTTLTASLFDQKVGLFAGAVGIPRAYQLNHDGDYRNIDLPAQQNRHVKLISNTEIRNDETIYRLDIGVQQNLRIEESVPHVHGFRPQPDDSTALGLDLWSVNGTFRLDREVSHRVSYSAGISGLYMQNSRSGFEFLVPSFVSSQGGVFGYGSWKANERVTFNGGARIEVADRSLNGFSETVYDAELQVIGSRERTPDIDRQFVGWALATGIVISGRMTDVHINLSRSFRFPAPNELGMNGVHHGTFRHEQGDATLNMEEGYHSDIQFRMEQGAHSLNAGAYFNFFTNYIYLGTTAQFSPLPEAGAIYRYQQDPATHTGFELDYIWDMPADLEFSVSGAYIYTYNFISTLSLPFMPPFNVRPELRYQPSWGKEDRWTGNVAVSWDWYAAQNRTDRNEFNTPGYDLLNVGIGIELTIDKLIIGLDVQCMNLLDALYMNHLSRYRLLNLPEPGRNGTIRAFVRF